MKYHHTFRVRAPLNAAIDLHAQASSLKAITPPVIPMQLHRVPECTGDGDEMEFTMWVGLPLLFAYRDWKTRRLLEEAAG